MHGLINRSIQSFVSHTYGAQVWSCVTQNVGLGTDGFEPMLHYEDALTDQVLVAVSQNVNNPVEMVLEDIGTYLVSHQSTAPIRRLLRFGGDTFSEFLYSLEDLQGRIQMAVPDLECPELTLLDDTDGHFVLRVGGPDTRFAWVLIGILRALADDFGVLAFLDQSIGKTGQPEIEINLLDSGFAEGRSFSLAGETLAEGPP